MRTSHLRYVSLAALALGGALAAQACSPTAIDDPPVDTDSGADAAIVLDSGKKDTGTGPVDSGKDTGTTPADTGVADTGIADTGPRDSSADATSDGSADASTDGSADGGGAAPASGSACAVVNQLFTKSCLACGTQTARCGADNKVEPYSFCQGAVLNGCIPGTVKSNPCGLCGTRQEVCQNTCVFAGGVCLNEPVGACTPGTIVFDQAGCAAADLFRKNTCNATCSLEAEALPCKPKVTSELIIGTAVASIKSADFKLSTLADAVKRHDSVLLSPNAACPIALSSSVTGVSYVKLINPNPTAAVVEVYGTIAAGSSSIDTLMTAYTALPNDDAARAACTGVVTDANNEATMSPAPECILVANRAFGTLCGENAVTVPANGSLFILTQAYFDTASNFGKAYKLSAKVKSL